MGRGCRRRRSVALPMVRDSRPYGRALTMRESYWAGAERLVTRLTLGLLRLRHLRAARRGRCRGLLLRAAELVEHAAALLLLGSGDDRGRRTAVTGDPRQRQAGEE